jgi:uncharacterized protein (DUF2384 family)
MNLPEMISDDLYQTLKKQVGNETELVEWVDTPNPAFEDRTPMDLIQSGESDRLWRMVHQVRFGAFA